MVCERCRIIFFERWNLSSCCLAVFISKFTEGAAFRIMESILLANISKSFGIHC